jgi:hypothetical protein
MSASALSTRKTSGRLITGGLGLATTRAGLNAFEINNIQEEETKSH